MIKPLMRPILLLPVLLVASVLYTVDVRADEPTDSATAKTTKSDHQMTPPGDPAMTQIDATARTHFVLIYRHGPAYVDSLPIGEQPGIEGHFRHVESYVAELPDFMILGGPFLDDSGALMIFLVRSEKEVRQFAESDPIVQSGLVEFRIHPWAVAVRSDSQ